MQNPKTALKFSDPNHSAFFSVLRKRVDDYFTTNQISRHANQTMVIKTLVLFTTYLAPLVLLVTLHPSFGIALVLWVLMGFALAGMGMSVMHDANHGAYSSNPTINFILGHSLNLLGGSVFNWKLQHNILHHTYTNIADSDEDIADKLVLKFNPHTKVKWYHKLQFIYAFLFYGILTLYWATFKDFVQFARYTRNGVNKGTPSQNVLRVVRMVLDKSFYFFIFTGIPILSGVPVMEVVWGFLLMHFVAGIVLTLIFQMAHTVEGTSHPLPDANGNIENSWAIHQLNTTVNFSTGNKFLTWYLGGLNFQVEHHLFPKVCHVHYPSLAPIVKQTAAEFGIPYLENKTFGIALRSHFNLLKKLGTLPDMNEAIG